ncbi:MAG: aspartate-semialdehyde dehydrogenase, partial [Saccharofermentanales bacterium]
MDKKYKVGVIGGTGYVGQRFLSILEDHPWFETVLIAASERSAGMKYEEAVKGRWKIGSPMPESIKDMVVRDSAVIERYCDDVDFVFCAVDMKKEEIKILEEKIAKTQTPVNSN